MNFKTTTVVYTLFNELENALIIFANDLIIALSHICTLYSLTFET